MAWRIQSGCRRWQLHHGQHSELKRDTRYTILRAYGCAACKDIPQQEIVERFLLYLAILAFRSILWDGTEKRGTNSNIEATQEHRLFEEAEEQNDCFQRPFSEHYEVLAIADGCKCTASSVGCALAYHPSLLTNQASHIRESSILVEIPWRLAASAWARYASEWTLGVPLPASFR